MAWKWTNAGSIDVSGNLYLMGAISTDQLGAIHNVAGTVALSAFLDNTGNSLTLNEQTGVWTLADATIHGGTLDVATATLDLNGAITGTGTLIKAGKTLSYAEADVRTGDGRLVAHGTSTLMRLPGLGVKLGIPLWAA